MSDSFVQEKRLIGYKSTDLGLLPDCWDVEPLGELFAFKNGLNKAKRFLGSGTPIVNYMDVFAHSGIRMKDLSGRVNLGPEEIKNFEVRLGDVFFTRTSETVEEVGVASIMLDDPCDTVFSGFVLRARPRDGRLNDRFKQYCFASRAVRSQIVSNATYTTRALTNGRLLAAVKIAVPPKFEQQSIAEALSDVHGLLATLEALIAKKYAIKQAAMEQLLTGKTRLPGFSGPWERKRLRDIAELHRQNAVPSVSGDMLFIHFSLPAYDESRCPVIELGNRIGSNKFHVPDNAVLVSKLNPRIPRVWAPEPIDSNSVASTEFLVLTPKESITRDFLFVLCSSPGFCAQMERLATGTTGSHQRISSPEAMKIRVWLPMTIDEQVAITIVLSDMDAEIAAFERRRDKTHAVKQGMMQQLLTGRIRLVESAMTQASASREID